MDKLTINGESYGFEDHIDYRNYHGYSYGHPYGDVDGDGCGSGVYWSECDNHSDCYRSLDGDGAGDGSGTAVWANPSLL